jgi:hypothetical protein
MDLTMMERVGDRWENMEGYCSTGQSPQRAVVTVEEEVSIRKYGGTSPEIGPSQKASLGFRSVLFREGALF